MKKKQKLLIGAHMSIAGGMEKSVERGLAVGCTTMQIFTKSNRQWGAKVLTQQDCDTFKHAVKESGIAPVVVHATYLINIGSPKKETVEKSVDAIVKELERCHKLGIPYLVLHPGAHLKTDEDACLTRIANNLDAAFSRAKSNTMILLETMAGQGSTVCYLFEHIAAIIKRSKNTRRIGVCFDTCHVFVAGYDFTTKKTYEVMWQKFDDVIGLHKLKAIHVNDSKKGLGARVDRHEDIGKGAIGLTAFELLFNDPRFFAVPKILETPKEELSDDLCNIATIKKLISKKTRDILDV